MMTTKSVDLKYLPLVTNFVVMSPFDKTTIGCELRNTVYIIVKVVMIHHHMKERSKSF